MSEHAETAVIAGHAHPIRIVPLHDPHDLMADQPGVPPTTPPKLTYRGGALLTAVEVFTVFWGTAWQSAPQAAMLTSINQFFDFILSSPLLDQLAEYNVPGHAIGHGKHIGTATLTTPRPPRVVTDTGIQHLLQQEIASNPAFPQPSPNRLYFVYLPPGVKAVQGGGSSCQAFCGYHDSIGSQVFYAVMPFPNCRGCTGTLAPLDALTSTSSHELCEAITDAVPGTGWYDDANGEIGDICAWKTKTVGPWTVQLEWSNQANACT